MDALGTLESLGVFILIVVEDEVGMSATSELGEPWRARTDVSFCKNCFKLEPHARV